MKTEEKKNAHLTDTKSMYEIPLAEGKALVKAWANKKHFTKAFLIDAQELRDIIDEKGASYVRVYFGWDERDEKGRKEKMIMVPADINGNDMIPQSAVANAASPESNVFDFTLPCPPTCDTTSPLFAK